MGETLKHVLIVEDDTALASMMGMVLEAEGFASTQVANGREALSTIDRLHPDLILLDMRMPVMDGWEFAARYIRAHDHETPIVVITAAENAEQRAKEVEAADWLAKPFDLTDLVALVTRYMQ